MSISKVIERAYETWIGRWAHPRLKGFFTNIIRSGDYIPAHVAFIMDGNRRYARQQNMSIAKGHELGGESMVQAVDNCFKCGVDVVTVYALSIENFNRPKAQVMALVELFHDFITRYFDSKTTYAIRLLGRPEMLPDDLRHRLEEIAGRPRHPGQNALNICIAYTSSDEMTTAIRKTVKENRPLEEIKEESLTRNMFTADSPPVDILIRTSAVWRLSNFLLWQCHQDTYIEIVDTFWPAFGMWDLFWILLKWQGIRESSDISCRKSVQGNTFSMLLVLSVVCGFLALPLLFNMLR